MRRSRGLQPDVPPLAPLPPRAESLPVAWRWITALVIVAYLALSAGHIAATPVLSPSDGSFINAPDEPAHLGYVAILAREGRLPRPSDPTYEWHQPPAYYAIVTPFFRAGPYVVRWVTMLMGLASVCLIFLAVRRLFPSDPVLAVLAMGLAALLPMRQAVYASVGNDALLELLCSAFFLVLVPAFTHGFTPQRAAVIGGVIGWALLTKANALLLIPIAIYALYLLRTKSGESGRNVALGALALFGCCLALAAPMLIRNLSLYGEVTPMRAFREAFAGTVKASDWIDAKPVTDDLWTGSLHNSEPMSRVGYVRLVANWTFRSFFAAYTPRNAAKYGVPFFPQPPAFYVPFVLMGLLAAVGLGKLHMRRREAVTSIQLAFIWMMFAFTGLVALAFAGFTWTYFQAQGRYLYPAMLPICVLAALGIRAAVSPARREFVSLCVLATMVLLAFVFLFVYIQPTYATFPAAIGAAP